MREFIQIACNLVVSLAILGTSFPTLATSNNTTSIKAYSSVMKCSIGTELLNKIIFIRTEVIKAGGDSYALDLITEAEDAASPPECDKIRAKILLEKAAYIAGVESLVADMEWPDVQDSSEQPSDSLADQLSRPPSGQRLKSFSDQPSKSSSIKLDPFFPGCKFPDLGGGGRWRCRRPYFYGNFYSSCSRIYFNNDCRIPFSKYIWNFWL